MKMRGQLLLACVQGTFALRFVGLSFRELRVGELSPACLVDSHHKSEQRPFVGAEPCVSECRRSANCIGAQLNASGRSGCWLKFSHVLVANGTCLANYRRLTSERGFAEVPVVKLRHSDGIVFMREDCMESAARKTSNSYWGVPWDWEQPGLGLSMVKEAGYGESPLAGLVTRSVLDDLIVAGTPPWLAKTGRRVLDYQCDEGGADAAVALLERSARGKDGGAMVLELGRCLCSMLSGGWDPRRQLRSDVVLLLHRDVNFSPASPLTNTHRSALMGTAKPCVRRSGNASGFASDAEAFEALAGSPRVRALYFFQTPPITHEKVFLTPLGVDPRSYLPHLRSRLAAPAKSRRALYEISHNLAVDYRREVMAAVQGNFGERLHARYMPWASGSRMADVVNETFEAVFGQSPIGIGENCYRHYELLLAGAIPVVQASLGIAGLRYFPHLAVSNWHEVTPKLLLGSYEKIWQEVREGRYSFEPLTVSFWLQHIQDRAKGRPLEAFYAKFGMPNVSCGSWDCARPVGEERAR